MYSWIIKKIKKEKWLYQRLMKANTIFKRSRLNCIALKLLYNKRYIVKNYTLITTKDYCKKHRNIYEVMEHPQLRSVFAPKYFGDQEQEMVYECYSPDIFIAEISNGTVIGNNSFVIAENECLNDVWAQDVEERNNLVYGSVRKIGKNNIMIEYIDSRNIIKKAITLVGHAANNYYHFTIDLLSRLQYIEDRSEYKDVPLLIDETAVIKYFELIERVNKNRRTIIPIKRNYGYKIEKLIYPSFNNWNSIYRKNKTESKPRDYIMARSGIEYLRNMLKKSNKKTSRKVFISRKNVVASRLFNEEEVAKLFKQFGYEIICPETMSFSEQLDLFAEVHCFAGVTGAAFTNMLYLPENAKVICIVPKTNNYYLYSTLARNIGLMCVFLDAIKLEKRKYLLDLEYCKSFLEKE